MQDDLWSFYEQLPEAVRVQVRDFLHGLVMDPLAVQDRFPVIVYPRPGYDYVELRCRVFVAWSVHDTDRALFHSEEPVVWIRHIGRQIDHNQVRKRQFK